MTETHVNAELLVSFYILSYNHGKFITDAMEGAVRQTYHPLEIIISDDCSTDGTREEIERFASNYTGPHKIVVMRNDVNLGISEHINQVWKACNGSWIVASAGDDISEPFRVERIVNAARQYPEIQLVQTWLSEIDATGNLIGINKLSSSNLFQTPQIYTLKDRLRDQTYAPHGAAMAYSRRIFENFSPLPRGVIFEDNIINLRAELMGGVLLLPEPLVKHRNHDGQITRVNNNIDDCDSQQRRLVLRLDSDVNSTIQNITDVGSAISLIGEDCHKILNVYFKRRLLHFKAKKEALSGSWPVRLFALARAFSSRDVAPFSRDDVMRSLLPSLLYQRIKQ